MGFIDPKKGDEDDGGGLGASGLHIDLDLKRCPACRRELTPWEDRCPDCGEAGVRSDQIAADTFALPGLAPEPSDGGGAVDTPDDAGGTADADNTDDTGT